MKSYGKTLDALYSDIVNINNLKITWMEIIWMLFLSFVFIFYFLVSDSIWIFNALVIPVILVGFNKYNELAQPLQKFFVALMLAVILTYGIRIGLAVYESILQPPEWDFHLYWIYGQVGSRFLNPYEPGILVQFAQTLNPSESFLNELYFFQFPPLIFLFLPLGWFEINTAAFLWYIFLLVVLMLDVILLWSIFCKRTDFKGLLLVSLLTLVLASTYDTLGHAQINFLVLLAFLLYWRRRESLIGGIWLGLGMMVKPILVIVLIYPILRRHLRLFLGVAVAIVVSSVITVMTFGWEMFLDYFVTNPIVFKMPNYMYTEMVNQSLLATILRLTNFDFSNGSPYLQPMFVIAAMLLTGITSFLVFRRKDDEQYYIEFAMALTIIFALLLFPKTLYHYAVLLIVPMLMIWVNRKETGINSFFVVTFIALEYVLVSLGGNFVFISILISWLFIAGICVKLLLLRPYKKISG